MHQEPHFEGNFEFMLRVVGLDDAIESLYKIVLDIFDFRL